MKFALLAGRIIIAGIFIIAGAVKLHAPEEFADSLVNYGFFSDASAGAIAIIFPGIELLTGISILTKKFAAAGMFNASAMSLLFVVVLSGVVVSGKAVDCGCFGELFATSTPWALARAMILAGGCLLLFYLRGNVANGKSPAFDNSDS